ncbi:MAG: molecular chaperone DnaK [Deltaproteobacteria bacterium]|nr:molecular chaperone DnaK [Deltaproteobacteria bacterium]
MSDETVIGIDLGTTNSCVAVVEGNDAVVIPNAEGSRTTPSFIGFTQNGERLVGHVAKRQAVTNAENTVYSMKRLMGRTFDSEESVRQREMCPYKIVAHRNGDAWVEVRGKKMSPPELSSMILTEMRSVAESYLGRKVSRAVVTVPAYFNDAQRQATKDAGKIAGLEVERIINEPTAAALAFGVDLEPGSRRCMAVYDLGGGTFDISILEMEDGVFSVKSTSGDTFLGGEDFDQKIINYLAAKFKEDHQYDLMSDSMALQRLKEASERAKHELSSSLTTEINLPFIAADASGPKHLVYTMERGELEDLVEDLVVRTFGPCEQALTDAGIAKSELNDILLVGGMTRMPLVQKMVEEFFGKPPLRGVNPDEVVAVGAAVQGAVLSGQVDEVLLLDVTPLSLGVETGGGVFTKLIERNTTVPTQKRQVFTTSVDNQNFVPIHVLQGERQMAQDNTTLARFELSGIPPAPRGVPQIQVTFDIDSNGIVSVSARDLGTGREQVVRVTAAGGLKDADIERIIAEAEMQRQEDSQRKELAEARVQAESLIYTSQKAVEEYGSAVDKQDLDIIRADIVELQMRIQGSDIEKINECRIRLEESAYRIAEAMYAGVAPIGDETDAFSSGTDFSDAISETLDGESPDES